MEVWPLKKLCNDKIINEISHHSILKLKHQLRVYAYQNLRHIRWCKRANRKEEEKKKLFKQKYRLIVEHITTSIMQLKIYMPYCVTWTMHFIRLEQDYREGALKLVDCLQKQTKTNVNFTIDNLKINTKCWEVDGVQSIVDIVKKSNVDVFFTLNKFREYFDVNAEFRSRLLYLLHTLPINMWKAKCFRNELNSMGSTMSFLRRQIADRADNDYLPPGVILYVTAALNYPKSILEAVHRLTAEVGHRQSLFQMAALSIVVSEIPSQEIKRKEEIKNLTFLLDVIEERALNILLKRFYKEIFKRFIVSVNSNLCLGLFDQLIKLEEISICNAVLCEAAHWISEDDPNTWGFDYKNTLYLGKRDLFLKLWANAFHLKEHLNNKQIDDILETVKNDISLVFLLINDTEFSEMKRNEMIARFIIKLVMSKRANDLCIFLRDFKKIPVEHIKDEISNMLIDKIFLQNNEYCYDAIIQFIFKDTQSEMNIKNYIISKKELLIKIIGTISQGENGLKAVTSFTDWLFDNNKITKQTFVKEKLIGELWLVDICKEHLGCTYRGLYPNKGMFKYFNVPVGKRKLIRTLIRNDYDFIFPICKEYIMNLPEAIKLLKFLFEDDERDARKKFELDFLSSRGAVAEMYQMFKTDFYDENLFMFHDFVGKVEQIFRFRKHWLDASGLHNDFHVIMSQHPNTLTPFENTTLRHPLLIFEHVYVNRLIIDANYRIFRYLLQVNDDVKDKLVAKIQNSDYERLNYYINWCALKSAIFVSFVA